MPALPLLPSGDFMVSSSLAMLILSAYILLIAMMVFQLALVVYNFTTVAKL